MYLDSLSLIQFKNYQDASLAFCPRLNFLTGPNGSGKTNLMDAIYYLAFCKSFFNPVDSQNILSDKDFFFIQGLFTYGQGQYKVSCAVKRNQKKVFKLDDNDYERFSDHIGLIPLVFISPNDTVLIQGGSEEKRKLIDSVISQCDHQFLEALMVYNRNLAQRNALLKSFAEKNYFDVSLLEVYDDQLIASGELIFEKRKSFLLEYIPVFKDVYKQLSMGNELPEIQYVSQLHQQDFKLLLKETVGKDKVLQYTSSGIHKDNLEFQLDGMPIKKYGSQGQQKTFAVALKLSQFYFIKNHRNFNPILLFDDIFDKLDPDRVRQLIGLVSGEGFGQVFISDTHPERISELSSFANSDTRFFEVNQANVNLKTS